VPTTTAPIFASPVFASPAYAAELSPEERAFVRPAAQGELTCDVAIIGGGYTGLSAGLHAAQAGLETLVLEAAHVGHGASGRNGGQVLPGQREPQAVLESLCGKDDAKRLLALGMSAQDLVREIITANDIPCTLRRGALFAAWKPGDMAALEMEAELLTRDYGEAEISVIPKEGMGAYVGSSRYHGGLYTPSAMHLNPLVYVRGLARAAEAAGARIFEGSPVVKLIRQGTDHLTLHTEQARITAKQVLLACNGMPLRIEDKDGRDWRDRLYTRMVPLHAYIGATAPLPKDLRERLIPSGACVCDTKIGLDYFRLDGRGALIFGGGESPWPKPSPAAARRALEARIAAVFPQLAPVSLEHVWTGSLSITPSRLPDLDRLAPGLYVAHGYSGHGVPIATLAGQVIAKAMAGDAGDFDVFARIPKRRIPLPGLTHTLGRAFAVLWSDLLDRL